MKRLVLFFLCYPVYLHGQWCIDFENGSLTDWNQARDSTWQVQSGQVLSGQYSLRHSYDDTTGNHDQIAIALDSLVMDSPSTSWKFRIMHAYPPSSANHWAVFLAADGNQDKMIPSGGLNAYVLGVNFTGSDDSLKLWKMGPGSVSIVTTTSLNWQEEIGQEPAYLNVLRSGYGIWKILLEKGGRNTWELIGEGRDTALISPDYFGIYYKYSSKQDRKFWFDDLCISGLFRPDTLPPSVASLEISGSKAVQLTFTEAVKEERCFIPQNFQLDPLGSVPNSLLRISEKSCRLVFAEPFPAKIPLNLVIYKLEDNKGNTASNLTVHFLYFVPGPRDIVFNEIMFDPSPAIGLPPLEYVELYNRSPYPVNLEDWSLGIGNKNFPLPQVSISGGKHLVLGYDGEVNPYGPDCPFMGLFTSGTSLPNQGAILTLSDGNGGLIDWLEYGPDMHDGVYFADGGWALEQVDPGRPCMHLDNWATSIDPSGGTPGYANSLLRDHPDRSPPLLANLYLPDSSTLILEFNEGMDPSLLIEPRNYFVDHGQNHPHHIECLAPENRMAILHFSQPFNPGLEYRLKMSEYIVDCSGLPVSADRVQRFALPVPPARNQVLVSEILFDPRPYCPRFIEIHNPADRTFDVADLRIAGKNTLTGEMESVSRISSGHRLFFPGDYLALTEDPDKLEDCCYVRDPKTLIRWNDLPVLDEKEGTIMILDKQLQVIDAMYYNLQMHSPLLLETEGVSLERIRFDIPADHPSNWHSAAATEGYSTPGRMNSQFYLPGNEQGEIEIEPEVFTPDQDGHDDFIRIRYHFAHPGTVATILVLDPRGRIIKSVAENQLLGSEGIFTWDGETGHGQRARAGIYLVYVRVFQTNGKVCHYKKTCVLSPGTQY